MTISTQDLRKIESSLRTAICDDYWQATNSEFETTRNLVLGELKKRNVKIEIDNSPVAVQFPVALVETTKAKAVKSSKLSESDIIHIRSHPEATAVELAKGFNVSDSTIAKVRHGLLHGDIIIEAEAVE
jgi:hypothetical protein